MGSGHIRPTGRIAVIALANDGTPFIAWKPGCRSEWHYHELVLEGPDGKPVTHRETYQTPFPRQVSGPTMRAGLVKTYMNGVARKHKLAAWMLRSPSKNPSVNIARAELALVLSTYCDDDLAVLVFTPDEVALRLYYPNTETMQAEIAAFKVIQEAQREGKA